MRLTSKDKWALFKFLAAVTWLIFGIGCAGAIQNVKKDATMSRDYAACEAEAKAAVRAAPSCSSAISNLIDLMGKPECEGFGGQSVEGGIKLGGVTYVCHEETSSGH